MRWRPSYEFKMVIAKGRRYRYWYLRVPIAGRWTSIYLGHDRPPIDALTVAQRHGWRWQHGLGTVDRQSLNRIKRWARTAVTRGQR